MGYNGAFWETTHDGKMDGIKSISSSMHCNGRCAENAKINGSICEKCYANMLLNQRSSLDSHLTDNYHLFNDSIVPTCDLPTVLELLYRLESFGDADSENAVINDFAIANNNPDTTFAVWTKNPDFFKSAIAHGYSKPKNLIIGVSSLFINKVRNVSMYSDFVDFVFTVFDADFAITNNVRIDCGKRICRNCRKCYTLSNFGHGVVYINEILKSDSKKYYKAIGEDFDGKRK